jgi:peptidoglycan/LPS O-acetylase OafA/YrhL
VQAEPSFPAAPGARIDYIDFAKGYAIFTVVVYHVLQRAGLPPLWQQAIVFGGTGVHLFFLLSGFGLAYGKSLAPAAFYRRRLTKVWLPYVLALTLSLLAALIWNLFPDRWQAWLAGVLLYQMFFERYVESFGGHFWFISAIVQFYLVFPGLTALRRVLPSRGWFLAICLAASVAWWVAVFLLGKAGYRTWNSFFLQFLWEFGLGMVLGEMAKRTNGDPDGKAGSRDWPFWTWPWWLALAAGVLFSGLMVLLIVRFGAAGKIFNDLPALIGYTALSVFIFQVSRGALCFIRWFFTWVGGFSFSLYLVHVLVLDGYLRLLDALDQAPNPANLLPVIPLALLAGRAFEPLSRRWTGLFEKNQH